jgi:2-methylisocitrate lyase-like PEP mutase family enzyme
MTDSPDDRARRFLALHHGATPLVMPNAWDVGAARLLAAAGFAAIATTSSGFAGTHGRLDGGMTRDVVLEHARDLSAAVPIPVSADLEDGYAVSPDGVAATVSLAAATGLAGCSVEDYAGAPEKAILPLELATERVRAAAEAAHGGAVSLVLTGRAENFIRANPDLADTIARLQAYQEAGADVLFAPGLNDPDQLRTLIGEVDRPVNVLVRAGMPSVAELGALGVGRISVGGSLYWVATAAVATAAAELLEHGTYAGLASVPDGVAAGRSAYSA